MSATRIVYYTLFFIAFGSVAIGLFALMLDPADWIDEVTKCVLAAALAVQSLTLARNRS